MLDDINVLILVGGRGTRLQSVVKDVPKPMAPIGKEERPFLDYLITNFRQYGLNKFTLLSGYKADIVIDYFKSCSDVRTIVEKELLGTGGAILNGIQEIAEERCLVVNGDTYFNGDPRFLLEKFDHNKLCMGLTEVSDTSRYGSIVVDENGNVTKMQEKNNLGGRGRINLGMYLFDRSLLLPFKNLGKCSMETDILPCLIQKEVVMGVGLKGDFIDIGVPKDFELAQKLIPSWL